MADFAFHPPPQTNSHYSTNQPIYSQLNRLQNGGYPSQQAHGGRGDSFDESAEDESLSEELIGVTTGESIEEAGHLNKNNNYSGSIVPATSLSSSSYVAQYYRDQSSVNIRNTRPMTAPSSVSAPYFQGGLYANSNHPLPTPSSSFYSPQAEQSNQPFQFTVDNIAPQVNTTAELFRARAFGLPDSTNNNNNNSLNSDSPGGSNGISNGVDNSRYGVRGLGGMHNSNGNGRGGGGDSIRPATTEGTSTFMFAPPPVPIQEDEQYYLSGEESSPEDHSRPGTADALHQHPTFQSQSQSSAYDMIDSATAHYNKSAEHFSYLSKPMSTSTSKRPRRRFDEIERLYTCDYPLCLKAYGTLNHLNSHKTMQKHGPKSTPAQFKELRKAWRDSKKANKGLESRRKAEPVDPAFSSGHYAITRPSVDRPRPATSAGEYHHGVSAAFHSSQISTPSSSFPPSQITMPTPQFQFDPSGSLQSPQIHTPGGSWTTASPYHSIPAFSPTTPGTPSSSFSHRPMTAPAYYNQAPSFGYSHLANGQNLQNVPLQQQLQQHQHQQQQQQQQQMLSQHPPQHLPIQQQQQHQPQPNFARRMSLPMSAMPFQFQTRDANGFSSIQEEGTNNYLSGGGSSAGGSRHGGSNGDQSR